MEIKVQCFDCNAEFPPKEMIPAGEGAFVCKLCQQERLDCNIKQPAYERPDFIEISKFVLWPLR